MRFLLPVLVLSLEVCFAGRAALAGESETIVFVRHGEKPGTQSPRDKSGNCQTSDASKSGLGQLTCQGLNRALKLREVIEARFGKPWAIFAPNPADQKADDNDEDGPHDVPGGLYDYLRPLATIEPTAVRIGLPVNTQIGFSNAEALIATLKEENYRDKVVVVAWEHKTINDVECRLLTGDDCAWKKDAEGNKRSGEVSKWEGCDFDRMDIVKIDWSRARPTATIEQSAEGLDGQPTECPK